MAAALLGLTASPANSWSSTDDTYSVVLDGSNWGNLHDVVAATDGGSYTCGHFRGTVDMDPDPANTFTVTAATTQPALIVKLDADGNYEWHTTVDSPNASVWKCAVDVAGNIYATGNFRTSASVGAGDDVTTSASLGNTFVAKFNDAGAGQWIRSIESTTENLGYGIDVDAAGNTYTTGYFLQDADLDLDVGTTNIVSAHGNDWNDTFLVKLDQDGNTQWGHAWGGTENTLGRSVVVDNAGDIVVGGWTNPIQMDIDPDPVDELLVGDPSDDWHGNRNAWLSKFDSTGDLVWGHSFGSKSADYIYALAVDASNNIYATGETGRQGKAAWGGNWQTNSSLPDIVVTGMLHRDGYVAKFTPAGDTSWVSIFGGNGKEHAGLGIAVSGDAVYSAGRFNWTVDFTGGTSTTPVPGQVENAGGSHDPYLVRHNAADGSFVCAAALIGKSGHEGL
ncbi:MAG: hypothetical protein QF844_08390, partial [Acidimicrobiales bacterium]|nr:hypothetical protein [Acidimicrobiales bacterium]